MTRVNSRYGSTQMAATGMTVSSIQRIKLMRSTKYSHLWPRMSSLLRLMQSMTRMSGFSMSTYMAWLYRIVAMKQGPERDKNALEEIQPYDFEEEGEAVQKVPEPGLEPAAAVKDIDGIARRDDDRHDLECRPDDPAEGADGLRRGSYHGEDDVESVSGRGYFVVIQIDSGDVALQNIQQP